jgi:hypothetical protein
MVFFYIGEDLEGSKPRPFSYKTLMLTYQVDFDLVKCNVKLDFVLTCVDLENKNKKIIL